MKLHKAFWLALLLWLLRPLLGHAESSVESLLVEQLKQGQVGSAVLQEKGLQQADDLFLLGWLYEQGGYGVTRDPERARRLLQQAAELGQFDAMHYCWQRCLILTDTVLEHLQQGVQQQHPQALYLQSQLGQRPGLAAPDRLLLQAARLGQRDAVNQLYTEHFIEWAKSRRSLGEAETKLKRCVGEGIGICYYLLGALFERHRDHEQALFYFRVLELVDATRFKRLLSQAHLQRLLEHLPQPRAELIQSRAASYLAQAAPTGNHRIDRFARCEGDYACAFRLSQAHPRCTLAYLHDGLLAGLESSEGYRSCLVALEPTAE